MSLGKELVADLNNGKVRGHSASQHVADSMLDKGLYSIALESLTHCSQIVVSDVGATIPGIGTLEEKFQFLYEACSAAVKVSCLLRSHSIFWQHLPLSLSTISKSEDALRQSGTNMQDDLNTAKVAVAIQAAGLEGEAHWTRQNLAQIIWYGLLLLNLCTFTSTIVVEERSQQLRHPGLSPAPHAQSGSRTPAAFYQKA